MNLTTAYGYSTEISAVKGSLWYNAGTATFDANTKITAKGSLNKLEIDMTLETFDGDGYLGFGATGITYGAGTGKIKVTMARDNLESTIAVNEGAMIIGNNLFTITAGSNIATDLKTLIPALYFTTGDVGNYTINGQKITTTAANLALTATDNQMIFKTSDDKILYEGMTFEGNGNVTLNPEEIKLGSGVVAQGFGKDNSFVLTEEGNVTVDAKIFELSESVSSGLTVKGSEDGFTFSRTLTDESEQRADIINSPDIGKIFTEVFTAKGDNSYRISADLLGLEEIIGMSNGVTVDGSAIFDDKYSYHYFNLVTDTAGKFTIGERTYTIKDDNNVAIRAKFYEDRSYAGYFESLSGSVNGDFSAGKFHINNSGEMQVFGDTEIDIVADETNLKISGLDFNASLKVDSAETYNINDTDVEAEAGQVIVGTYNGSARLYNKNFQENILSDTVMTATYNSNTLINTGENVKITAHNGKDHIHNYGNKSSINSGGSADNIYNEGYNTTINGGTGNDTIENKGANTIINGGLGNDSISNNGENVLYQYASGDGKDTISGFGENDTLQITKGTIKNTLFSGEDFVIQVGSGSITFEGMAKGTTFNLINADGKAEVITVPKLVSGTAKADSLDNDKDEYGVDALGGNDSISNSGDNVTIIGGKGNDSISNNGENVLYQYASGDGKDTIFGFKSNDTIQITNGVIKFQTVEVATQLLK